MRIAPLLRLRLGHAFCCVWCAVCLHGAARQPILPPSREATTPKQKALSTGTATRKRKALLNNHPLGQVAMGRAGGKASYGAARTRGSVAGAAPRRGRLDDVFRSFVRILRANLSPSANTATPLSQESCRNPVRGSGERD